MRQNKHRRVFAGILALAAGAWIIDRAFLGATSPDAASASESPATVSNSKSEKAVPVAASRSSGTLLADRIAAAGMALYESPQPDSELFGTPHWQRAKETGKTGAAVVRESNEESEFRTRHTLTGVVTTGNRAFVVLNGRPLKLGESVSGYQLVAIERQTYDKTTGIHTPASATFRREGLPDLILKSSSGENVE